MPGAAARAVVAAAAVLASTTCSLDRLLVLPQGALLCVTPSTPDTLLDSAAGGSVTAHSNAVAVNNCGAGVLRWNAVVQHGSPWVSIVPDSGTVAGLELVSPQVIFSSAGLDTGVFQETVVINSASGNGAAEIPVRFTIHPCRITPMVIDESASATLGSADCGAPHRPGGFARIYGFPGTANDSVSVELSSGFDAYVILDTTLDQTRASWVETDDSLLYYQRLPRNTTYYVEVTSAATADTGPFTLHLAHPRLPRSPVELDQRLPDSVTSIATGATVSQASILLRAVVSDPDLGDSLRLEAEVRPATIAFSSGNVPIGPATGNGQPAWVMVSGLADKTSYHWRVRAGEQTGRSGPWVTFVGNPAFVVDVPHAPNAPTALGQAKGDGTGILTGATIDTDVVILSATVSDADPGDQLHLAVEVRPVGTAFSAPTDSSLPVTDGGPMQVTVGPLLSGTSYHWRARAVDQTGAVSAWVAFGGNVESATDFRVDLPPAPPPPSALNQYQSGDLSPIPVGGYATSDSVILTGVVGAADASQPVQLEVEVQPIGQPFSGLPNFVSPFGPSNVTASAVVGPLVINRPYHWQARARDTGGRTGTWRAFPISPGNLETAIDFSGRYQPPPVQLVFSVQPTTTRTGSPIVPAVEVLALDSAGQPSTGFTGSVTITLEPSISGGKLNGTTTVSAVAGVATFANLSINKPGLGYRLRATTIQPSLTVVSEPFNAFR